MINRETTISVDNVITDTYKIDPNSPELKAGQPSAAAQPQVPPQPQPQPQPQLQPQFTAQPNGGRMNDFMNTNNTLNVNSEEQLNLLAELFTKPISDNTLGERATKLIELFKTYYENSRKQNPAQCRIDFIPAPGNKVGNLHGGFIVAIPLKVNSGETVVGTHFVIVETNAQIKDQIENINNVPYRIVNTPGNTVNERTDAGVEQLVRAHYAAQATTELKVLSGGFTVVPLEFDLADTTSVQKLADFTTSGAMTRINMSRIDTTVDEGVTLAQIIRSAGVTTHANVEERPQNPVDVRGLPIRADFIINTTAMPPQTQNSQEIGMAVDLGSVAIFNTLFYAAPDVVFNQFNQMVPAGTQHYYNRVVIKEFIMGEQIRPSVGTYLLLLGTAPLMSVSGFWKRAYTPDMHIAPGQTDTHDIGAIGYEVPLTNANVGGYTVPAIDPSAKKEMYPTKTAEFDPTRFDAFMNLLVRPELVYSIDVPDGHYLLDLFLAEASGDQTAHDIIANVLNGMTGGAFSKAFDITKPMFKQTPVRVMDGFSVSSNTGRKFALDEIDHLALLNLVSGDATTMLEYERSMDNVASAATRLALRTAIIDRITAGRAKVKGYSTRIDVSPDFMAALVVSLRNSNLFPELNATGFARTQAYTRPTQNMFASLAVDPNRIPNLFNQRQTATGNGHDVTYPYVRPTWGV